MRNEIDQKYNDLLPGLDKNDPTYEGRGQAEKEIEKKETF